MTTSKKYLVLGNGIGLGSNKHGETIYVVHGEEFELEGSPKEDPWKTLIDDGIIVAIPSNKEEAEPSRARVIAPEDPGASVFPQVPADPNRSENLPPEPAPTPIINTITAMANNQVATVGKPVNEVLLDEDGMPLDPNRGEAPKEVEVGRQKND